MKVNLCSGPVRISGYVSVDIGGGVDVAIDLEKDLLPFGDNSVDTLVFISAINYFSKSRAQELLKEIFRVLKPRGVFRVATQDLKKLATYYINEDKEFFFEKLPTGRDRYPGNTMCEKINEWFYGFETSGKHGKYVYDAQTLSLMLNQAGFLVVEEKEFLDSVIPEIKQIDNRPEQMFFLECVKPAVFHVAHNGDYPLNRVAYSDATHLSLAMKWLCKAYDVTQDDGVSAYYSITDKSWYTSYPETTGYIIPTMLNYWHITQNDFYKESALKMGYWLISIQEASGGVGEAKNAPYQAPRVFNTGQIIFGWLALYELTKNDAFLIAAKKAGDWLLDIQNHDGSFSKNTYMGERAYHIRAVWSVMELYRVTKDEKYKTAVLNFLDWFYTLIVDFNWIQKMNLAQDKNDKASWSHSLVYTMRGVYELSNYGLDERLEQLIHNMLTSITDMYLQAKQEMDGTVGLSHVVRENWTNVLLSVANTSTAQLAVLLFKAYKRYGTQNYKICADMLVDDLNKLQLVEVNDENLLGGLMGSYPNNSYCSNLIPNWGVKFYADALMGRMNYEFQSY